jgi:AraC-like DNA-binding protein/quercetin dioxygenase-like cupin family protein
VAIATYGVITEYDPPRGVSIATLAYEYRAGFQVPEHAHGSDQLIYAIRGVMEVSAGQGLWLIPPHFGLWIPARTRHSIRMPGAVSMRILYVRPGLARPSAPPAAGCAVVHVSPLLRELIVEAVRIGRLRVRHRHERALRDLLLLHLERASPMPTGVILPKDPRARAVAESVLRDPGQAALASVLCAEARASVRTIERKFRAEVGSDFETWRRQVRLMKALELLVSGHSVKEVAFRVGYRQPATFIEMFRRMLGTTPKAWAAALEKLER